MRFRHPYVVGLLILVILTSIGGLLARPHKRYHSPVADRFVSSFVGQLKPPREPGSDDAEYTFTVSIPNEWNADAVLVCPSYQLPHKEALLRLGVDTTVATALDSGDSSGLLGPEGVSFYLIKGKSILFVYSFALASTSVVDQKFLYSKVGHDINLDIVLPSYENYTDAGKPSSGRHWGQPSIAAVK